MHQNFVIIKPEHSAQLNVRLSEIVKHKKHTYTRQPTLDDGDDGDDDDDNDENNNNNNTVHTVKRAKKIVYFYTIPMSEPVVAC